MEVRRQYRAIPENELLESQIGLVCELGEIEAELEKEESRKSEDVMISKLCEEIIRLKAALDERKCCLSIGFGCSQHEMVEVERVRRDEEKFRSLRLGLGLLLRTRD